MERESSFAGRVLHQIRVRPRLATATALGLVTFLVAAGRLPEPKRALLAWDVGAGLYVVLAWTMMLSSSHVRVEKMKWRARMQDDGALVVLVLTLVATVASVVAIVFELLRAQSRYSGEPSLPLVLSGTTILLSWCFIHTAFALHYAHEFYIDRGPGGGPGLEFPGGGLPEYVDFLYFSFVIATTSQTSDVAIVSRAMRRLALLHGVLAFFFNTTLLALTVNIAAGLFGQHR